ncbi:MAG: hypothetical protein ACTHLH_02315, partial [Solirubrobacterales bacterium]
HSEEELRAGIALAYQIFVKPEDARLGVNASAEELGRAVKAVAGIVPDALRGLSFSTYEGHPVFPFDLIGAEAPAPGTHRCSLVMPQDLDEEALLTLHQLAEGSRLGSVASHVAGNGEGAQAAAIWKAAREIFGLSRGKDVKGAEGLLADSGVVGFICSTPEGRAAVAAAAHRGNARVLSAVASTVAAMDEAEAGLLVAAIAERCRSTREVEGCAAVSAALGEAGQVVLDAALDLALEDEGVGASLGAEDAVLILARASERAIETAAAHPLLRGARRRIDSCAGDLRIPTSYLAAMFGFGLEDPADGLRLVAAARARPELLGQVQLDGAEKERCLQLLQRLDSEGKQTLLPALLLPLAEEPWGGRLLSIVRSLPTDVAALCVLNALQGGEDPVPSALSEICESLAADLLASDNVFVALRLLEASGTAGARQAVRLIQGMGDGASTSAATAIEAGAELGASALGPAIAELAIARAVAAVERPPDVAAVWMAIEGSESQGDDGGVLRSLLSYAARRSRGSSAVEILAWIARNRVPADPKLLTMRGAIRDSKADELALEVASRVPEDLLKEMEESVKPAGRGARKWWKRLRNEAAKF